MEFNFGTMGDDAVVPTAATAPDDTIGVEKIAGKTEIKN